MRNKGQTPRSPSEVQIFLQLLAFAGSTWLDISLMAVGAVCAAASGVPFPLMALLFGELVDDLNGASCDVTETGSGQAYMSTINDKVLQLVYIAIAAFALIFTYVVAWGLLSQRVAHRLRISYFQSLLRQDMAFFDQHQAGEVSVRLNADVQAVQSGTCEKVGMFIASVSFFITAYVIAFIKQARLAGMLISLVPAFLLVAIIGGGFFHKFTASMSDAAASAASTASEALSHVDVVQAFGAEQRLEQKFANSMAIARQAGIKKGVVAAIQAGMLYFIAYSANALAFWQGSRMIARLFSGDGDGSSVGEIYTVVFIVVDACVILGSTAPLLPLFGSAASAFRRLKYIIDQKSTIGQQEVNGLELDVDSPGFFQFCNVSFAYPSRPDEKVLENVRIDFPVGERTAIVGPSGSGKSTITGLLNRLYDPNDGEILLDGINVRKINVRDLRGLLGVVQQEPTLLNCSIFENIAVGLIGSSRPSHKKLQQCLLNLKSSDSGNAFGLQARFSTPGYPEMKEIFDLVIGAAKSADASSFIEKLEKGYETNVGIGGKSLSGGQRQRIALARALIRDPKILVLDEATASLDSATEQRIQVALDKASVGRTVITVAHRLSTVKNANNILVLKNGIVEEEGTYEQLLSQGGTFANMVKLQELVSADDTDLQSLSSVASRYPDVSSAQLDVEKPSFAEETENEPVTVNGDQKDEFVSPDAHNIGNSNSDMIESNLSSWVIIRNVSQLIRPSRGWLVMAIITSVIVGSTYSASGLIFGHTVGALALCNTTTDRILYVGRFFGGMLFMLAVVEFFANLISWSSFALIAERLLYRLRVLSFRSLLEQNFEWHHSKDRDSSSLLSVLTKDSAAIGAFSGSTIGTIFSILVNFVVAIILSHIIAWKIAIVCLAMVPILLGSGIMQLYSHSRFEERHSKAFSKSVGISVETVTSIKAIILFSLEDRIMDTYHNALESPRKEMLMVSVYTNVWLAISNTTGFFIYAFAYWWGSQQIMKGENSQQQFFIVLVAMLVSAQLWGQMFTLAPEVSRARASASRVLSLINLGSAKQTSSRLISSDPTTDSAIPDLENPMLTEKAPKVRSEQGMSVVFQSVNFVYPSSPQAPVLQDTNLVIQRGQFCGIVGASGAGKSTIMRLILGMYNATSGTIALDGLDITRDNVRSDVAYVPQDNALFSGSIKFNVGLGARPGHEASDEEIEEACRIANIHDMILSLPDKYDTECGPNGSQLSGGQRQRLAIARALVRKPRLLLLDESTSALDAETEKALQDGLERAVRGSSMTVIAITHRLHTVLRADVVFVIDGGRVADYGRHEELLVRSEAYRLNAQFQML